MSDAPVEMTHDQYMNALHPDYRRIIRGRKHIKSFDADLGRFVWVPVRIVPRREEAAAK